jgi:hypothetical protein
VLMLALMKALSTAFHCSVHVARVARAADRDALSGIGPSDLRRAFAHHGS